MVSQNGFLLNPLKFIYSEKITKFCEIFAILFSYVVPVKSKVEISQNFVAFSEYMNFNRGGRSKMPLQAPIEGT